MKTVVYRLTNRVNGKVYVGISCRGLEIRVDEHEYDAMRGGGYALHRAIRKYGPESFDRALIATVETCEEAAALEVEYIAHHRSFMSSYGYNMTRGGDGSFGYTHTAESKEKMSRSRKGRVITEEWRANLSASTKGRKQTEESNLKRSLAHRGRERSPEYRAKISATLTGRKNPAATAEKHGGSKLSNIDRVEIYNLRVVQKTPRAEVAARFGIAVAHVYSVVQCVIRNGLVPVGSPTAVPEVAAPPREKSPPVQLTLFDFDDVEVGSCDTGMCPAR